jgi:outer membrane lipoprotein SlyB
MRSVKIAVLGMAILAVVGCAERVRESGVYTPQELANLESYRLVEVVHAERVMVDPETPGVAGMALGGAAGAGIGSQAGSGAATLIGAVVGGVIGYAIEQQATDTTATRYVINDGGVQRVMIQKDSGEPLEPGDTAMLIGDYDPRLVKAPPEIIDAAAQNSGTGSVRVNEETGVILFDEYGGSGSQVEPSDESWGEPSSGTWVEPQQQQ